MNISSSGGAFIDEILYVGGINNYNGGSVAKLVVYASDSTGIAAYFKHPNDSQGIGIAFDGIITLNAGQNIDIATKTGSDTIGQVRLK